MFHKNIPNNNKDIIRFLAKNFAGTKKVRNTILFCSIVIGIVAITMVFGISFGKIQAEEIRLIRENGTASSGRIEDGTEEQYAKLKQLDYIKQVGKSIFVGEATEVSENNAKTICDIVWADSESWNNFLRPAYTNVIGSYPQKKDEILLSERALKKLGISEPEQGMEINLDVYKGVFEHSKEKFELCGWYTDSGNELAIGYISHDKIKELKLEKGPYTLLFSQSDHLNRSKTEEKLYQTLPMKSADQKIYVSDTAQYTAVSKFAGGYEMDILGTLGILYGIYFLVRNVLWISMSEDIQNLGLLHTIGATERQITKIYRKQMRLLMLKGSVLGSLISVLILVLLIPEILGFHFYQEMGGNMILSFFCLDFTITGISHQTSNKYNHIHPSFPLSYSICYLTGNTRVRQIRYEIKNQSAAQLLLSAALAITRAVIISENSARLSFHMCNPFQGSPNPFTPLQAVSAISCMVFRFLTLSDRHHREYHY